MSRQVYLLGVGLALVAIALGFTDWALSLQPGVTERNVNRVRDGMSVPEVEALMGKPHLPGVSMLVKGSGRVRLYSSFHCWVGSDGIACLLLRPNGRAWRAVWFHRDSPEGGAPFVTLTAGNPATPGPLGRLRTWLAGLAGDLPHDAGNLK